MRTDAARAGAVRAIGRPGALKIKAATQAVEALGDWRQELALIIGGASSTDEVERHLAEWGETRASDPALADLVHQSSAMAWMAGQLFVRDHELPSRGVALADVQVGRDGDFLSLVFREAVELFAGRRILPAEEFYAALGDLRQRAFTATRLATEYLRRVAFEQLVQAIDGGGDFASFAAAIRSEQAGLGIAPSGHGYLSTVFETNVVSAYSAGRDRQLTGADVVEAVPFRVYVALDDNRVRASHLALNGVTWDARATDAWRKFQGPNDFNCRCMVIASETAGPRSSEGAVHPAPGFAGAPTLEI